MDIKIIGYDYKYAKYFYDYNIEWLETFFFVEPYDQEVLSKPETYIIDKGGYIFFAKNEERILGTVALMPTKEYGILELTKMAVLTEVRDKKIGQKLFFFASATLMFLLPFNGKLLSFFSDDQTRTYLPLCIVLMLFFGL